MAISAQDVKQLKELTNCGMMDCKRALEATNGNVEEAVKYLREQGLAKQAKKAGRIAAVADVEALKEITASGTNEKIADVLTDAVASISENIQIRRFVRMTGDVYAYVHNGGGSIIGSLIKLESDNGADDTVKTVAKDLLLQITASAPQFVAQGDVPASVIDAEKEVQLELVKKENAESKKPKPENVLEKIVEGRMRKFAEEICLLDQPFVKDPSITVAKYIANAGKNIKVIEFARLEKGEGIQKREDDFAAEVASMVK